MAQQDFDKNKTAVALSYEAGDEAPKILASGKGAVAQRIIDALRVKGLVSRRGNRKNGFWEVL